MENNMSYELELLVVFKEDFNEVLRPVMEKQWMDKKSALKALNYFDLFSGDQIVTACKLGVLRQFEPLETIYYDNKDQLSYVYFVLSGECMILQCLKMTVTQIKGGKAFELVEISKENTVRLSNGLSSGEMPKNLTHEVEGAADTEDGKKEPTFKRQKRIHLSGRIENHFIDVGSLTFGGIIGLGERFEHRKILARTAVQCLLLPRFWLFEKDQNNGNIWQRRRFYLDTTIPTREALFTNFVSTQRWENFKNSFLQMQLDPNSLLNPTKVQDIPIYCRLVEAND